MVWVEAASLLWRMLQSAITQASRHTVSLERCLTTSAVHNPPKRIIFERTRQQKLAPKSSAESLDCFWVTRNSMFQLSGTPGLFTRKLPIRKVQQPAVRCHVATVRGRAKVTWPLLQLNTVFLLRHFLHWRPHQRNHFKHADYSVFPLSGVFWYIHSKGWVLSKLPWRYGQ